MNDCGIHKRLHLKHNIRKSVDQKFSMNKRYVDLGFDCMQNACKKMHFLHRHAMAQLNKPMIDKAHGSICTDLTRWRSRSVFVDVSK